MIEIERECFFCNHFFSGDVDPDGIYGVCLDDPDFTPYIDELLEEGKIDCCRALYYQKRMSNDKPACEKFDPVTIFGEEDEEEEQWSTGEEDSKHNQTIEHYKGKDNIEKFFSMLYDENPNVQSAGLNKVLIAIIMDEDNHVFERLVDYYKDLPVEPLIDRMRWREKVALVLCECRTEHRTRVLVNLFIADLKRFPSNRSTKSFIDLILEQFYEWMPMDTLEEKLYMLLGEKKFSEQRKQQILEIMDKNEENEEEDWFLR